MRRTASILLLAILLLSFIGPGVYYPVLKCMHHYQMQAWLKQQPPGHFIKMVFNASQADLLHLSAENEFETGGKRYDIVRRSQQDGNTVVYCVNDKEEELLFAAASGKADNSSRQWQVIKSISLLLYHVQQPVHQLATYNLTPVIHTFYYVNHYRNFTGDILSPPPQG